MHECCAMQILKVQRIENAKRRMVTKSIEMKHNDHVKKTQLNWAFCIQNFLDAVRTYVVHMLRTYVIILCNWLIHLQNALYL